MPGSAANHGEQLRFGSPGIPDIVGKIFQTNNTMSSERILWLLTPYSIVVISGVARIKRTGLPEHLIAGRAWIGHGVCPRLHVS